MYGCCILFQVWFWVARTWISVWIFVICFGGGGSVVLKSSFVGGVGVVLLGSLRGLFFIKGIFFIKFFLFSLF